MKSYCGGQQVRRGVYLDLSTGEFVRPYGDDRVLPGRQPVRYVKVPSALAAAAGPLLGLMFIVFLPLAGLAGLVSLLGYRAGHLASELGRRVLQPVLVTWRPGHAYLTRKAGTAGKGKAARDTNFPDMSIDEIEAEIARRRNQGEQ